MSKPIRFCSGFLFLLLGLPLVQTRADYESFESRVEQLESELANLKAGMNSMGGGGSECDVCDDCGCTDYSGWIVGIETPVLKAHNSLGVNGAVGTDLQ